MEKFRYYVSAMSITPGWFGDKIGMVGRIVNLDHAIETEEDIERVIELLADPEDENAPKVDEITITNWKRIQ